jgi:membrane protein required for colicin V production
MDMNYFDIISLSIILLLGLKGIFNGFFKEVFGLIGIVGGIFIASRYGHIIGDPINSILKLSSQSAINLIGFIITLAIFWLAMIMLGHLFKKFSTLSGLGPVDKLLGFAFGASKFFLIASVIAYAAYNIKAIKSTVDSAMEGSVVFPLMVDTGSFIMKIDPVGVSDDIEQSIEKSSEAIKQKSQEAIEKASKEEIQKIQKELNKDEK